jgi:predicted flap endonuclease-1-like 5' DNA nuclease/cell division protein FtsL
MLWLNILNNENLVLAAETLIIVIGSMLLGILLSYLNAGGTRAKLTELAESLEEEKKQNEDLREQVRDISQVRAQLQSEMDGLRIKIGEQAKTIYDQQQYINNSESAYRNQKSIVDGLNATIESYQQRLSVIQEELEKARTPEPKPRRTGPAAPVRANFEHVSQLLGRQVTDNDLTLITGIGARTAALLQANGIDTWEDLANTSVEQLQAILHEAGGVYKSQDSTHWAKQAIMASQGEWRKLRVFQETLRKTE